MSSKKCLDLGSTPFIYSGGRCRTGFRLLYCQKHKLQLLSKVSGLIFHLVRIYITLSLFFSLSVDTRSLSNSQLMMNISTITSDKDKQETLGQFWVVSHALSDVIVYFGVKQRTRRQNELVKITSTVLAASSLLFSLRAPLFFLLHIFSLNVYLPDSLFSIVKACLLLYSGGVSLWVLWGVHLLILTKLCSDAGFSSFTFYWTLTLNLGFDGKQTLLWPCNSLLFTFTTLGFFKESGMVTIVMASFKLPWR